MRLLIRTEASSTIGMGHLMRCFAVAEAARERGWDVTFLLSEESEATGDRVVSIGADIHILTPPLGKDAAEVAAVEGDWLLIDSYSADAAYIAHMSSHRRVAVVDDLAQLGHYDCDLIINPAQAAADMGYEKRATRARLLLGPQYALIRGEFRRDYPQSNASFMAVMFGGSDPDNLTAECVRRIRAALPDMAVRVIAGPANRQVEELRLVAQGDPLISLYESPPSVAEVLAHATLVVTAAGGTLGEVAAMGLPALGLVAYDNQVQALRGSVFPVMDCRRGFAADLGDHIAALIRDEARLKAIGHKARAVVDGRGPERIMAAMEAMSE